MNRPYIPQFESRSFSRDYDIYEISEKHKDYFCRRYSRDHSPPCPKVTPGRWYAFYPNENDMGLRWQCSGSSL